MKVKLNIIPDVANKNGHIYPKKVIDKAIKEYNSLKPKLGTISSFYEDVEKMAVDLQAVAFEIKNIYEDENNRYVAEIEVLDTPAGEKLKEMILNENEIILGHIAMADIDENGIVQDDLTIMHYSVIDKNNAA